MEEGNYKFVFCGRFTQDCIENLFSILRSKHSTLNALQFKNNLKLVTTSQYMRKVSSSNYEEDDREFLPDFLKILENLEKKDCSSATNTELPVTMSAENVILSKTELNILNNVAGYIISSILKTKKCCDKCIQCVGSRKQRLSYYSKLTVIKSYRENTLFFVNQSTFTYFVAMEKIFRGYNNDSLFNASINLRNFFINKFMDIPHDLPQCCHLKQKIVSRYAGFRLKINSKKGRISKGCTRSSKTMAMHYTIK